MSLNWGYGGIDVENTAMGQAMQRMSEAIGQSAQLYSEATTKVTDLAKEISDKNIAYLQQTGTQSQQVLAPFQIAGQLGTGQLENLLGVNGSAAQQQSMTNVMQSAGNAGMSLNFSALNQMLGTNFSIPPTTNPANSLPVNPGSKPSAQYTQQQQQQIDALRQNIMSGMSSGADQATLQKFQQQLTDLTRNPSNQQALDQWTAQDQSYRTALAAQQQAGPSVPQGNTGSSPGGPSSGPGGFQTLQSALLGGQGSTILNYTHLRAHETG